MYKTIEFWQEVVICSELTTSAVESPTDGVYFINEVKRAEEKNRRQEVHIRQLSLNFAV